MAFRISNDSAALTAQRHLDKSQRKTEKALQRLASGSRFVHAGDDAAGFAISESLRGQISGLNQSKFNAQHAKSLIQTAEGGLNEQNNIVIRLRELAVQAASDTTSETERGFLNTEFQELVDEFDRIAKTTRFGQKKLLTGSGEEFDFQVGPNRGESNRIEFNLSANTTSEAVGIEGLDVDEKDEALYALEWIDEGMKKISGVRAQFGAIQSRMQYAIDNLSVQSENLEEARSLIADVDVAKQVTQMTKGKIFQDIGTAVLAQANADSGRALRLLM